MARKTVAASVQKWSSRVSQSQQYYTQGINEATNWAENAVAAAPQRNAGLQAAISDGRIDAGINRLGTAAWKRKTLAKGPANWLTGVSNATPAYRDGLTKVYGFFDTADAAVSNMPRATFADRLARMQAFITSVHNSADAAKSGG